MSRIERIEKCRFDDKLVSVVPVGSFKSFSSIPCLVLVVFAGILIIDLHCPVKLMDVTGKVSLSIGIIK